MENKSVFRELNNREKNMLITLTKNDCKKLLVIACICAIMLLILIIFIPSIARWLSIEPTPLAIVAIGIGIAGLAILAVFFKNKQMLDAIISDKARCYDDTLVETKPIVSDKRKLKKNVQPVKQPQSELGEYIPFSPHTREDLPVGSLILVLVWNVKADTKKLIFDAALF